MLTLQWMVNYCHLLFFCFPFTVYEDDAVSVDHDDFDKLHTHSNYLWCLVWTWHHSTLEVLCFASTKGFCQQTFSNRPKLLDQLFSRVWIIVAIAFSEWS